MKRLLVWTVGIYLFCFASYLYYMHDAGRFEGLSTVLKGLFLTLVFFGKLIIYLAEKIIQAF